MLSFRTELENPIVSKEILELDRKIREFRDGKLPDDSFKSLRLARGIYGQRQPGVQMVRMKLPFGKVTFKQLLKIADVSDEYATGNLHLTTRQDVQIHFVSLDRTPELWAELAADDLTLREACGNTVRNVTASPMAGIDPHEPFDVSPYAQSAFAYFVRNPICQEMGRKFKIAFSSSSEDTAFAYIHDLGFIPKVRTVNGQEERGFRVVIGGGLGAQPMAAHLVHEFLHEDLIIPYAEATIRVFGRYGERTNRNKARLKFLIQKLGLEEVLRRIDEELVACEHSSYKIDRFCIPPLSIPEKIEVPEVEPSALQGYDTWEKTNVRIQKQPGFFSVAVKVSTGDVSTQIVRTLLDRLQGYVAEEIRITQNQGLLFKFVRPEYLPYVYSVLDSVGLARPGFDSLADVTTCPGTDTCNLGISNSTEMARVLENLIHTQHAHLVYNRDIKIKISGCMNSCGQHSLAQIGFHGSSLKVGTSVIPAAQIMLGGGSLGDGLGRVSERVIKIPSKRVPEALTVLLADYEKNAQNEEPFNAYYDGKTKAYFYALLKPLASLENLQADDYQDWGQQEAYIPAIGVGECAGVIIDLVATLLFESEEKIEWAKESLQSNRPSDAIFHGYSVMVNAAKALLLQQGIQASTQAGIIEAFDRAFIDTGMLEFSGSFEDLISQAHKETPTPAFAEKYVQQSIDFFQTIQRYRTEGILL